jgi:hypothetical protein
MNFNCFSQTDTLKNKVVLGEDIARDVVKDLVRLDGCEEKVLLYEEKIDLIESREAVKDSVIQLLTIKDSNNQHIISLKDEQLGLSKELIDDLKKEVRRRKTEGIFLKIGSAIAVITSAILIGLWH